MQNLGNSEYLDMMQIPEQFNVSILDKFAVTTINHQNPGHDNLPQDCRPCFPKYQRNSKEKSETGFVPSLQI